MIIEAVKWFILSEELIPKESHVLAAVSGGQDSMAMLSILHRLSSELDFSITAAHFDHCLRPTGDRDRDIVECFAKSCSLELIAGSGKVAELAADSGDTIEEAARRARYDFLHRAAEEIGASRIATGHTKDDQIETVVMRLLRGCGVRGLAGIPTQRGDLIRPLIAVGREQTGAYCDAMDISLALDPTNEDPRFFRNRIRLEVLPYLRGVQSSVDDNILRLSANAGKLIQAIRERTNPLLKRHSRKLSNSEWNVEVTKLSGLDDTSLVILFGDLFTELMQLDMDFTQPHFERLVHLARNAAGSGKMISLPGLRVKREFENLIFTLDPARHLPPVFGNLDVTLPVPGRAPAADMMVAAEVVNRSDLTQNSFESSGNTAYFAVDRIKLPLKIRYPVPGDRLRPFGMRGTKKVSDIFIDSKIPGRERSRKMILCDAEEILWVVGVVTSEKGRIGENTEKILKITIQQE